MAASQNLSPGGALLRASRMFAIPAPLPRPQGQLTSGSIFASDSATLPYPTHQAITTPPSSLSRGDWGLKRPLPLRSTTKTSTPLVRVNTMDTYEHVTEFTSAADHVLTLKKWQGMSIPLSTPIIKQNVALETVKASKPSRSVFEEDLDYTAQRDLMPGEQDSRWKFNGPWLAGQTEMEFDEYLTKDVRRRKTDFHDHLRHEYVALQNAKTADARRTDGSKAMVPADVTEEQFSAFLRDLRSDRKSLFVLIRRFLDLPPAAVSEQDNIKSQIESESGPVTVNLGIAMPPVTTNPYAYTGPPKTHPSGGLSYLRTRAHLDNHPLSGPQASHAPIQARVIQPKNAVTGGDSAKLGVAGMVANIPIGLMSGFNHGALKKSARFVLADSPIQGLTNVNPNAPGGSKVWVAAKEASLNPEGRVQLMTRKSSERSTNMVEDRAREAPPEAQRSWNDRKKVRSVFSEERGSRSLGGWTPFGNPLKEDPVKKEDPLELLSSMVQEQKKE